jgi:hypothetical protein
MKKHEIKKSENESLKKYSEKLNEFSEIKSISKKDELINESEFYDDNNSRTILSEDLTKGSNGNKNQMNNQNKNNYNKLKQNTIETVLENEGNENCSYNQNSDNHISENDPIVTFLFYKESSVLIGDQTKLESCQRGNQENLSNDQDQSLSLNFNRNNDNKNELNININKNCENDNKVFNINDLIDNISQSEILANLNIKKDKSISVEKDNFEYSKEKEDLKKNTENKKKDNKEENLKDNNQQTEKFNVLFSEIVDACPIIQLSADTSKVK